MHLTWVNRDQNNISQILIAVNRVSGLAAKVKAQNEENIKVVRNDGNTKIVLSIYFIMFNKIFITLIRLRSLSCPITLSEITADC